MAARGSDRSVNSSPRLQLCVVRERVGATSGGGVPPVRAPHAARRSLARTYTAAELAMRPMKRGSLAIRRAMPHSTSGRE